MSDEPDEAASAALRRAVMAHNVAATGYDDGAALASFVHDENGDLVAGLEGFTWGGYAMVEWLWVREDYRGHGLGQRLVRSAEAEAQERGCRVLRVNSHSFQAPHFYSRLGYTVIGSADDTPVGHGEVFFTKRLDDPPAPSLDGDSDEPAVTSPPDPAPPPTR